MDYNKLFVFYNAAKYCRFSNTDLNLSPSVVSRHVADLEHELGYKLFIRAPKGLLLTAQGEQLYLQAADCFEKIRLTQDLLSAQGSKVHEELDVFIPTPWALEFLVQQISSFIKSNPHLTLNIISDDSAPLVESGVANFNKVAILPYAPKEENLVRRFLISIKLGMYASQEYLQKHGIPKTIADLANHQFIASSARDKNFVDLDWHLRVGLENGSTRRPIVKINNMAFAAAQGLGIASLAEENLNIANYKLVRVLPQLEGPTTSTYYVYPEFMRHSVTIKSFGDFLVSVLTQKSSD